MHASFTYSWTAQEPACDDGADGRALEDDAGAEPAVHRRGLALFAELARGHDEREAGQRRPCASE